MAPTASHRSQKIEFISKKIPVLQEPLKESEKKETIIKSSVDEDQVANELKYFKIVKPCENKNIRYIYIDDSRYGLVWPNITMFFILHLYYIYAMSQICIEKPYKTWLFSYFFSYATGIGVTAGAHRLWSHRGYKAVLPLRIFLMMLFTAAGQNDLYTWVRDHRLHHKFTETDADPHNSHRGMFFAHVGWLLTRKHPDVMIKGRTVDMSDIKADPVVMFQRKYYVPLYLFLRLFMPIFIPFYFWNETVNYCIIGVFAQYIGALHATWFVNSAAHLFGSRPYNHKINPRNNEYVNFVALGEGHHNYHHTFPWDYAIDEYGAKMNFGKLFIDGMAKLNLAYGLKKASPELVRKTRERVQRELEKEKYPHSVDPYLVPHEF